MITIFRSLLLLVFSFFILQATAATPGFFLLAGVGYIDDQNELTAKARDFSNTTSENDLKYIYNFEDSTYPGLQFAIGYNFLKYFGTDIYYRYWGKQDLIGIDGMELSHRVSGFLTSNSFGFNLIGYVPIEKNTVNFFGEAGLSYNDTRFSIDDPDIYHFYLSGRHTLREQGISPNFGVGMQYNFTRKIGVNVAFDLRLPDISSKQIHNFDYRLFSANFVYNFGS